MTNAQRSSEKTHYICQTYVETKAGRHGQTGLKIAKQYEYSTASEAQNRAEREALSEVCVGADAYMVIEDPISGEVGVPNFLVRLGNVPEFDHFWTPENGRGPLGLPVLRKGVHPWTVIVTGHARLACALA